MTPASPRGSKPASAPARQKALWQQFESRLVPHLRRGQNEMIFFAGAHVEVGADAVWVVTVPKAFEAQYVNDPGKKITAALDAAFPEGWKVHSGQVQQPPAEAVAA